MNIELIKAKIKLLYEKNPIIHVNVSLNHPKIQLRGVAVQIEEIYPHVFRILEIDSGKRFTLQYTDILIGRIEVLELGEAK